MDAIHDFLCRLFFYLLAIMFFNTVFGGWPEFSSAAPYFTHYGPRFVTYIALFEAVHQIAHRIKHGKAQQ